MKNLLIAALLMGAAGHFHAALSQSLSPDQSRQTQFLWEKLSIPYEGVRRDSLQPIFAKSSREHQALCLALCQRSAPLPEQLLSTGIDSLEHETLLMTSKRQLARGWNSVVLPASAIAPEHATGLWTLLHDGQSHDFIPDQPVALYIEENATLTSIGLKLEINGTSMEQHLVFPTFMVSACPDPDMPPWPINDSNDPWWIGCFLEGQAITGQALLKTSPDGIFDQPVILCEGFDPAIGGQMPSYGHGDLNWEVIWNCSATPSESFQAMPAFIDSLNAEGMDFVFLDFADGTQSIAQSAALLEHLIQLCNDYQQSELRSPLVVVGASMGGLVARHALRKMELEGVDHCTRLFLSIDSPFRGAWLPLAVQHAVTFLSDVSVDAADLCSALNSPAARQMLFESPNGAHASFSVHQALQADWGLPEIPLCAAISNGNPAMAFPTSNTPLLHATSSFLGWDYVNLWLFAAPGDPQYPDSDSNNWCVFDGQLINTDWEWGEDFILNEQGHCTPSFPAWGALPGSASSHLTLLRNALEIAGISVDEYQDQSLFIPVHSAFDLPLSDDWSVEAIPFDAISTQPMTHPIAMHADIGDHAEKILTWIVDGKPINTLEFEHHFGWNEPNAHWIGPCVIPAAGKVTIGGPEGNGMDWQQPFYVESSPCSEAIELPQFGTLILGDTLGNGVGILSIQPGTQLVIGPGSKLHIGPSSQLHIEEGAQLILNGGEVIVHPGGTLNVHSDGQILVSESSHIACNGPDGNVLFNGDLIVSDGKTIQISPTTNHAAGSIEITEMTAYVQLGIGSVWEITGQATDPLAFTLQNHAGLSVHGAGILEMTDVQLDMNEFSALLVHTKAEFQQVNLHGSNASAPCAFYHRLQWNQGTLHNAFISHQHPSSAAMQLTALQAFNSEWSATQSGLHMEQCNWNQSAFSLDQVPMHSWIRNSSFESGFYSTPQLQVTASEHILRIESSVFSNHSTGIKLQEQQANLLCNVFDNLSNGLHIDSLGKVNIAPPFGKNTFMHNNRHVLFNHGLWLDCLQGGNAFGPVDYRYFEGTIAGLDGGDNAVILLACNGNDWSHCAGNGPCVIAPIQLESSGDGTPIFLKDAAPVLLQCNDSNSGEIQPDQDDPKAVADSNTEALLNWMVYPNPVLQDLHVYWVSSKPHPEQVQMDAFDSAGNLVLSLAQSLAADGAITCSVVGLTRGWYSLHLKTPDGITQAFQIILSAP
jgi:hypothetical protein